MSGRAQHLAIVSTVLLVVAGVTIVLGQSEDIGWVLAIVLVVAHLSVITVVWSAIRRLLARRRQRSFAASDAPSLAQEGRAH